MLVKEARQGGRGAFTRHFVVIADDKERRLKHGCIAGHACV